MKSKKILIEPLKLPWRLDLSMTDFKLNVTENAASVLLVAFFIEGGLNQDLVVDFETPFFVNFRGEDFPYNWMANKEIENYSSHYDRSLVPFYEHLEKGNFDKYHELHNKEWTQSSFCPDPNVYLVKNSSLFMNVTNKNLKHYLLIGNDICIDVVATGMNWKIRD